MKPLAVLRSYPLTTKQRCAILGPIEARLADLPDASDRPLGDLASFLPLACDIEHDHVAVSSRLWIDANVRSPRTPATGVIGPLFKAARVALPPNVRDASTA